MSAHDVHVKTAVVMFGVNAESVTPDMRRQAKAINFSHLYRGKNTMDLDEALINALKQAYAIMRLETLATENMRLIEQEALELATAMLAFDDHAKKGSLPEIWLQALKKALDKKSPCTKEELDAALHSALKNASAILRLVDADDETTTENLKLIKEAARELMAVTISLDAHAKSGFFPAVWLKAMKSALATKKPRVQKAKR